MPANLRFRSATLVWEVARDFDCATNNCAAAPGLNPTRRVLDRPRAKPDMDSGLRGFPSFWKGGRKAPTLARRGLLDSKLCQGAPASAMPQPPIEGCFLRHFRHLINIGASFTGP
jgi:hypothetical protein